RFSGCRLSGYRLSGCRFTVCRKSGCGFTVVRFSRCRSTVVRFSGCGDCELGLVAARVLVGADPIVGDEVGVRPEVSVGLALLVEAEDVAGGNQLVEACADGVDPIGGEVLEILLAELPIWREAQHGQQDALGLEAGGRVTHRSVADLDVAVVDQEAVVAPALALGALLAD